MIIYTVFPSEELTWDRWITHLLTSVESAEIRLRKSDPAKLDPSQFGHSEIFLMIVSSLGSLGKGA